MDPLKWTNTTAKANSLTAWEKNPRKISDEQLEHLKRSIERFNYASPVLVDVDGRIVAGHMRVKALIALGRSDEELDVRMASRKLTEEEFKELAIRDNANMGSWDIEELAGFGEDFLNSLGMEENLVNKVFPKPATPHAQMVKCPKCTHEFERKGNSV